MSAFDAKNTMGPIKKSVAWILLAAAVTGAFLASCGKAAPRKKPSVPVEIAQAKETDVALKIQAIGTVDPIQTATLRSQVSGYLQNVFFQEGQRVIEGQPLFQIDARMIEATQMQAEAALEQARIQAKNAQDELRRADELIKEKFISQESYDRLRATAELQQAAVKTQEASLKKADLDRQFSTIRSPISGTAGSLMVHKGDLIKANDTIVVAVNQIDPIYVKFSIPEKDLGAVREALAAGEVSVTAIISKTGKEPVSGKLVFVDSAIDARTSSIMLKAQFGNEKALLWPGQFVDVVVVLGMIKNAVVVPTQAVLTGQKGSFVFVVDAQNKADIRPVAVGLTVENSVSIKEGLKAGETVVIDGQAQLGAGTVVDIRNTPAPGPEKSE